MKRCGDFSVTPFNSSLFNNSQISETNENLPENRAEEKPQDHAQEKANSLQSLITSINEGNDWKIISPFISQSVKLLSNKDNAWEALEKFKEVTHEMHHLCLNSVSFFKNDERTILDGREKFSNLSKLGGTLKNNARIEWICQFINAFKNLKSAILDFSQITKLENELLQTLFIEDSVRVTLNALKKPKPIPETIKDLLPLIPQATKFEDEFKLHLLEAFKKYNPGLEELAQEFVDESGNQQITFNEIVLSTVATNNPRLEKLFFLWPEDICAHTVHQSFGQFQDLKVLHISFDDDWFFPSDKNLLDSVEEIGIHFPTRNLYDQIDEISMYKRLKTLYLDVHHLNVSGEWNNLAEEIIKLKECPITELAIELPSYNPDCLGFMRELSEAVPNLKKIELTLWKGDSADSYQFPFIPYLEGFPLLEEVTICIDQPIDDNWLVENFNSLAGSHSLKTVHLPLPENAQQGVKDRLRILLPNVELKFEARPPSMRDHFKNELRKL